MKRKLTGIGSLSEPGTAGTPVIKSFVTNGLRTTDRWHEGILHTGSLSKCIGIKTTGICDIFLVHPDDLRTCNCKEKMFVIFENWFKIFANKYLC